MTAEWHKPVKAVMDYFKLDHVTLAGLSMGGCLVVRAAALEARVENLSALYAERFLSGMFAAAVTPPH